MSIKDATIEELGVEFATKVHNEFVQTRTDQIMMGEDLTRRINGVANQVKSLNGTVQKLDARVGRLESKVDRLDARVGSLETKVDRLDARVGSLETKVDRLDAKVECLEAKVDAGFDKVDGQISSLQKGQLDMMNILIAIQRKLDVN
ncbi:coiled-coil domain-containing protein [Nonomuraea fuscirosea]|uniref:coiled-coil domain-containing protein n=1 Tax=Nonomuraea fuscirosea TaxID=1291556 RepID=UPI00371F5C26